MLQCIPNCNSNMEDVSAVQVDWSRKILLGVTGSVAAVKTPEIICKLMDKFGPNVYIKVVLTRGGKYFWDKAPTYDAVHWQLLQGHLKAQTPGSDSETAKTQPKIQLHRTFTIRDP
jgi:Flavoprotein